MRKYQEKPSCVDLTGINAEDDKAISEAEQPLEIAIITTDIDLESESRVELVSYTAAELETICSIVEENCRENMIEDMYSSYCLDML